MLPLVSTDFSVFWHVTETFSLKHTEALKELIISLIFFFFCRELHEKIDRIISHYSVKTARHRVGSFYQSMCRSMTHSQVILKLYITLRHVLLIHWPDFGCTFGNCLEKFPRWCVQGRSDIWDTRAGCQGVRRFPLYHPGRAQFAAEET